MIIQGNKKRMPAILKILGEEDSKGEGSPPPDELESVAQELIEAVKSDDVSGVVSALRACFACMGESNSGEG